MTAFIDHIMQGAARSYGRDYERSMVDGSPERRMMSADRLRQARRVLDPREVAVMDMTAGRGVTVADLVKRTGTAAETLEALFLAACQKLAAHYEAAVD